jgi:hypothetical protein
VCGPYNTDLSPRRLTLAYKRIKSEAEKMWNWDIWHLSIARKSSAKAPKKSTTLLGCGLLLVTERHRSGVLGHCPCLAFTRCSFFNLHISIYFWYIFIRPEKKTDLGRF